MSSASGSIPLRCNDCGAHSDIVPGGASSLVASLHAFVADHTECSYQVSLVELPDARNTLVAEG